MRKGGGSSSSFFFSWCAICTGGLVFLALHKKMIHFSPLADFFYPSSLSVRALCVSHSPTILTLCKQALIVLCMHGCVQSEVVFYDINVYGCNSRACFISYHLGITAVSDGRGYMNAESWRSFEYFLKRICLFFLLFPTAITVI